MKVEVINNPRNQKDELDFYNDVEAFEYIHDKILSEDTIIDWFDANDWGNPYELTLNKFVNEFGSSISVGDYTYRLIEEYND